jgi:hypothetical protein
VVIPNITHYGIYYEAHQQAQKLALEWFDKYLKPRRSSWGRPPGLQRPLRPPFWLRPCCGAAKRSRCSWF